MVCFIHRPEYYTKSTEDGEGNSIKGLAELIIAKHRSGAVGDVKLRFVSKFARFDNWDEGYQMMQETFEEVGQVHKFESKMNSESHGSGFSFPGSDAFGSSMPDIMPGPGESPVPF